MLKRIVVLLLFVQVSFGQEYGNEIDTMKLCSSLQANNFGTDAEAELIRENTFGYWCF